MRVPWAKPFIDDDELNEVVECMKSTWLTMGPRVEKFEKQARNFLGVKHGIAVNNGTAALDVALKMIDIQPGDEVIIPALTYIATANAVLYQHAKPVLADIDTRTFNIDPNSVKMAVTRRTKCIMPIDYGGQGADYDALTSIAMEHGMSLVVDGAQSFGGEYKGSPLCSFGRVATTSFHAAKIITSIEGGMIFTNDDDLAKRAKIIRNQGEDPREKYYHTLLGHNYRMTDLHAAIGLAQFNRLDRILKKRASIAEYYNKNLQDCTGLITLPYVAPYNKHAWFLYTVLVDKCDTVQQYLSEKGIDTRRCWRLPIHCQPLYKNTLGKHSYPVAERVAGRVLNLPMYYAMTEEEQDYVIANLKNAIM
jgi:perosamine synthetase